VYHKTIFELDWMLTICKQKTGLPHLPDTQIGYPK